MGPNRSLRVVLAAIGSRGDVQPMLALAQALAARGHDAVVAAPENFESWVSNLGFKFVPLGVDMQQFLAENPGLMTGNPLRMLRQVIGYFKTQSPLQVQQLASACHGADAMVYGGLAFFAAPSISQALGLPALGVLYSTCLLPSRLHPPPMIPWQGLPGWMNQLLWRLDQSLGDWLMRETVNAMRAGFALPPVEHVWKHLMDDRPLVIAVDEVLFPFDPRQARSDPYVNFLFFEDPLPLDPELDAWLGAGEPPVFVGFGSMSGPGTERIGRLIVEAVSATGRRCVLDAGWAGLGAGSLPPNWRVVREAPHALLFARCAVVVHHGGSGTTAQALRAGVPQVVLPLILDQFHQGHRLHLGGLAPRPLPMESVTASHLGAAIKSALLLPAQARQTVATRLQASDAGSDIAQRLEKMVGALGARA